ncbi:Triosephosphate isomerase [Alteracholeplasma palmae J233]|uniref:Triosephosphate isomerase n=1 Tax=Alteracholeplasma palmae (strain ATCC 49389 / J233) TaxID=1318466 RepID=U4KJT0_ALTPJ|nr:triose-phosphate isomerase [Alteracholeplasma palmae]CCV63814.1 Triosephosphate isomerase [Alteracholeplasma palmae J233]
MKRVPVIAANWKMYKSKDEALEFIFKVNQAVPSNEVVESIVFPPAVFLNLLVKREGENLRIGAQNMHYADEGAFTGENSPMHVKTAGAEYVLVGHSERRIYYNEVSETVNLKLISAFRNDLIPILCVGETLEIKEEKRTQEFVNHQVEKALINVDKEYIPKLIVAYEPRWAIGTGKNATAKEASGVITHIREKIASLYSKELSEEVRIIYGGSVKPSNIEEILKEKEIDGALIGGAALDPENFIFFTQVAEKIKK